MFRKAKSDPASGILHQCCNVTSVHTKILEWHTTKQQVTLRCAETF